MPGLIPGKALGLIETLGLVGAIEACDAAAKAADVVVTSAETSSGGLVVIKIFGELGAVQAAVESGSAAASRVGQLYASHIIPNPDDDLDTIMGGGHGPGIMRRGRGINRDRNQTYMRPSKKTADSVSPADPADLENMKVTELRAYARTVPNLAIKGREISRADKDTLLREIRRASGDL